MRWLFNVYRGHCRITLARYMQYRVELHIWLAQIVLKPIVFLVVWAAAARALGGTLNGFTPSDFAAYFIVAMLVHHFTMAWLMIEWEPLVRTGDLSYMLLRPSHILHRFIAENLTFKSATGPFMLATAAALTFAFKPAFSFETWSLLAGVPALLMGAALFFTITWALGNLSFFTTEIDSVNVAFFLLMLVFSGQMAPIGISPPAIQTLAQVLPFWWIIGFPTELILGHLTPAQAARGIATQAAWVGACCLLMGWLWRRGVKSYTAVGL